MNHLTQQWAKVAAVEPFGYMTARAKDGTALFPTEDVNADPTRPIQNVSEVATVAAGKWGFYPNGEDYTFRRVKVDHWELDRDGHIEIFPVGFTFGRTSAQQGPVIAYPAEDGKGKWHAINKVSETPLCGIPASMDTRSGNSIHVSPTDKWAHPIVCKKCLRMSGWTPSP